MGVRLVCAGHIRTDSCRTESTYADPYYAQRVTSTLIEAAKTFLEQEALLVELIVPISGVATHPEDDLILATALNAGADFLGTRDRQLLKLGTFHGTTIVHPADLVDLLDSEMSQ